MLTIDYWLALVSFSSLERQWRTTRRKGKRLETEHASQLQRSRDHLPERHRHKPVCRFKLRHAARSALGIDSNKSVVVKHQQPIAGLFVNHVLGRSRRQQRGA